MYRFGVVAGDMRMKYMCDALTEDGYDAILLSNGEQASGCDVVILPIGMTAKGINAPFIFGSVREPNVISYVGDDYFKARNALPTAEGAIEIAMQNTDRTISGSRVTVIGYGCCGKALVDRLSCLDAFVTAVARRSVDRAVAENCGAHAIGFEGLSSIKADIIFNTVPAMVLTESVLQRLDRKTLIIDIASKPGGVDFDAAERLGIKTVHALGIPGKYAPRSAGEILKNTVLSMLSGGGVEWNKK